MIFKCTKRIQTCSLFIKVSAIIFSSTFGIFRIDHRKEEKHMVKHKSLLVLLFCVLTLCFTFTVHATTRYTVRFVDTFDGETVVLNTQAVEKGKAAHVPSKIPTHKGFEFSKWSTSFNKVNKNLVIKAIYKQTQSIIDFINPLNLP